MKEQKKAVILLSGGMDSTTVLALAKKEGYVCHCLSFDYGQRHRLEIKAAQKIAAIFNAAEHRIVSLDIGQMGGSALTDSAVDVPDYVGEYADDNVIPATYVPARNTIFLSIALGYAEIIGAYDLFIGASSVDYSGYPDCRPDYFEKFAELADLATKRGVQGQHFQIHTPLIHLSKAQTIQMGRELGVDYDMTVSCYQMDDAGHGCGRCDACVLRQRGFDEYHAFEN